jgi:hypothetical protein
MDKLNQKGGVLSTALLAVMLIISLVFGIWAFGSRQSYKNNVDQKIAVAVGVAQKQTQQTDAQKAAQQDALPLKDFIGPATYGSLHIKYPKTWSAYVSLNNDNNGNPINGYFQPNYVPDVSDTTNVFALRIQISGNPYSQEAAQFTTSSGDGTSTVSAFSLANVPNVVGIKVVGQIAGSKQGTMVLLPLRDKTIEIWTETDQYLSDFNNNILPNVTFNP